MNWFPLRMDLIEDPEFIALSPSHKVYYLTLLSDFNLRGEFYRSDQEFAILIGAATDKSPVKYPYTLDGHTNFLRGVSVDTIRRARRSLKKKGWINFKSGTRSERGTIATTYTQVHHARTAEGVFHATMHRPTFDTVLSKARYGPFVHGDVVTYAVLTYWRHKQGGREFWITKRQLRKLTGLKNAPDHVARLYSLFRYSSKNHLFMCEQDHHKLYFASEWSTVADPNKNKGNWELAEQEREHVLAATDAARQEREKQEIKQAINVPPELAHEPMAEDLPKAFKKLFTQRYGDLGGAYMRDGDVLELMDLGVDYQPDAVLKALVEYFRADDVPNLTFSKRKTLRNFLKNWPMLYTRVQSSERRVS